jgi:hypothetical protein
LVAAFVYNRQIDQCTFDLENKRISSDLEATELARTELMGGSGTTEDLLLFAANLLGEAAAWWSASEPQQRAVLQDVLFPNALSYGPDGFRTAETCPFWALRLGSGLETDHLASPTGFEPVFWP